MRFVRLLPARWQKFLREVLKFGAVGGLNGVINYAVFNVLALTVFADGQLKANVIATVVATCSSYLLNRHWTYRDRPKSAMRRESLLFFLFNAAGLVIELGVLALAKYGLGISGLLALNVAKTVGVGLATVFRFWSYRTFVFRKTPATPYVPVPTEVVAKRPGSAPTAAPAGAVLAERDPTTAPAGAFLAELDPAAELAEAVTKLAESDNGPGQGTRRTEPGAATGQPLEVQFAESIDVALETELASELNATPRRSSSAR